MNEQTEPWLFPLDSEMWRINSEWCGLVYGPAAAILQIAHPKIARGVAEHSDFKHDTLGRLQRTLHATNGIAFGTEQKAKEISAHLHKMHAQVRGKGYSAFEPDLLIWVLATLIMAAIQGYELVHGPLSPARKEQFYQEMVRFGTFFGVNPEVAPPHYPEFEAYYANALADESLLGTDPLCAELASHIARPRDNWKMRGLGRILDFASIELVPSPVRERLGLVSTPCSRGRLRMLNTVFPGIFRNLPGWLRLYPEARERLRKEPGSR